MALGFWAAEMARHGRREGAGAFKEGGPGISGKACPRNVGENHGRDRGRRYAAGGAGEGEDADRWAQAVGRREARGLKGASCAVSGKRWAERVTGRG